MRNRSIILASALAAASLSATAMQTQAQLRVQEHVQERDQRQVYGSQLMTPAERIEYRERLRAAKTIQERDRIRAEHHVQMQQRAKERGVKLPPAPPLERGRIHQNGRPGAGQRMPPRTQGSNGGGF